jgi:hypothetical protein
MNYESIAFVAPPKLTLTSPRPGTTASYTPFLFDQIVRDDNLNVPTLLDFTLAPCDDPSWVKLTRGDYIVLDTVTYPKWFTGYITNDPELTFLGPHPQTRAAMYGYKYEASSDEYLLSLKPLGILTAFYNKTQGEILAALVNVLQPGRFDVSNITDGQTLARYVPDPAKKFQDVVKEFADASNYRFWANNHVLFFVPQGVDNSQLIIDAIDPHYTPSALVVSPVKDSIVNDAIVLGDIEPQAYMNEYFAGDGLEGSFSLIGSPYGTDSAQLLDEQFSGSAIDETKWNVNDVPQTFIRPDSGFLNILGGMSFGDLGVNIMSSSLIPLEGNLRITHGEYDFVDSASQGVNGVICGLWGGTPTMDGLGGYPGCFYGIEVSKSGVVTTLRPIVNGVVDTNQSIIVDPTLRYVFRTLLNSDLIYRFVQQWYFMGADGSSSNFGGSGYPDTVDFATSIAGISITSVQDPVTGEFTNTTSVTTEVDWFNDSSLLTADQLFANYVPAASNDLHCTLTNITISSPMQAKLYIKPSQQPSYIPQTIGPNEIDSYDGHAPRATISTTNAGVSQKSTTLGSPKYNPGNATLQFFKDTANLTSTTPQLGDLILVKYRQAGAAVGRVQNTVNVAAESAAWGDDGLRSITRKDLVPLPRTSEECEAAAAAIISDLSYQHFEGTYSCPAPGFSTTGDLLSGTVLQFRNLPSGLFPVIPVPASFDDDGNPIPPPPYTSNFNDVIQQVKTTILSTRPSELFNHDITFGRADKLAAFLAKSNKQADVFAPQDSAEVPFAIDLSSVGSVFAPDVVSPTLTSWDRNTFNIDAGQAPPVGGGFEIRYTDTSWGCDSGKNLVTRTASRTFQVPRNVQGRAAFIRAYDTRNKIVWSNDFTQAAWHKQSATVINQSDIDPNDKRAQISTVTLGPTNGEVWQLTGVPAANISAVATVSLKGVAGQMVSLRMEDSGNTGPALVTTVVPLTGNWVRASVALSPITTPTGNIIVTITNFGTSPVTLRVDWASLEVGTALETAFCKTLDKPYGSLSRNSAGVRVAFPGIPPSPTATIDATSITAPIVNVVMPTAMQDVYGIELRAVDNATVLLRANLSDADFLPYWVHSQNTSRAQTFYVYTFNLLGEYSDPYIADMTIPSPSVAQLVMDESTRVLHWASIGAIGVLVEIATDQLFTNITWHSVMASQYLFIGDTEFYPSRWFRVTAYDDIGQTSTPSTLFHHYAVVPITSPPTGGINVVPPPPTPTTNPIPPTILIPSVAAIVKESLHNYATNGGRRLSLL